MKRFAERTEASDYRFQTSAFSALPEPTSAVPAAANPPRGATLKLVAFLSRILTRY